MRQKGEIEDVDFIYSVDVYFADDETSGIEKQAKRFIKTSIDVQY